MKNDSGSWGATFGETRARQMLLGLQMTPIERLRWLDQRRAEIRRLSGAKKQPPGGAGSESGTADEVEE